MNLQEALIEVKNGKAICRPGLECCGDLIIIFLVEFPVMKKSIIDSLNESEFAEKNVENHCLDAYKFSLEDVEATDWRIYERLKS